MDGTPHPSGGAEESPRPPRRADLSRLAAELNRLDVRYLVVGGFAIIEAGYPRFTADLNLLVDTAPDYESRLFEALRILPDRAVDELDPGDLGRFNIVRVGDEILVDLMKSGCGVTYAQAIGDAVWRELDGGRVPFASPRTLWKMKQTVREKDIPDRLFLRKLLQAQGIPLDPPPPDRPAPASAPGGLRGWLRRTFGGM